MDQLRQCVLSKTVLIKKNMINMQLIITNFYSQKQREIMLDSSPSKETNKSQLNEMDLFEMLASVLVTIARGEHILQSMREILVTDPAFTPMSLFKYLSRNQYSVHRKKLIAFLDENSLVIDEKETFELLRKIFSRYKMGEDLSYTAFINFVYPFNTGILRQISTNRVKGYPQFDKYQKNLRPADSVISGFLLLLNQELTVEKKVQVQISDPSFPNKQKLRKIIKSIKKASLRLTSTITEKSEEHISMLQIRNFIKAFIDVPEHLFLGLGRILGMDKSGKVAIENIEAILKKSRKKNNYCREIREEDGLSEVEAEDQYQQKLNHKYVPDHMDESLDQRHMKQLNYREELYRQLANTLKIPNSKSCRKKNKTPRAKSNNKNPYKDFSNRNSINQPPKYPPYAQKQKNMASSYHNPNHVPEFQDPRYFQLTKESHEKLQANLLKSKQKKDNYGHQKLRNKQKKQKQVPSECRKINGIFKQFIQLFLKANKEIQKCRNKLNSLGNIDFLNIFKSLDNGKGVVQAQDIRQFYIKLSGIPIDYDFQLLVDRFSQPDQKWLSYSQFADIFRASNSHKGEGNSPMKNSTTSMGGLTPQLMRLMSQTIYLILDLQQNLDFLRKKLKKADLQWLFCRINVDSDSKGFINYQQLKKYVVEELQMNVSMMDLMSLLKRLDKSKNGVVVKEQFLTM